VYILLPTDYNRIDPDSSPGAARAVLSATELPVVARRLSVTDTGFSIIWRLSTVKVQARPASARFQEKPRPVAFLFAGVAERQTLSAVGTERDRTILPWGYSTGRIQRSLSGESNVIAPTHVGSTPTTRSDLFWGFDQFTRGTGNPSLTNCLYRVPENAGKKSSNEADSRLAPGEFLFGLRAKSSKWGAIVSGASPRISRHTILGATA